MSVTENLSAIKSSLPAGVQLIAVSKTHPAEMIREAYNAGQLDFGENKVQEMSAKHEILPQDIRWHMIGHLQSNKIKYIAPFVHLIHSVDSLKLLQAINKEAVKCNREIDCLLQVHIATEETKFGFSAEELTNMLSGNDLNELKNIRLCGLMGMATFTDNEQQVKAEFKLLVGLFKTIKNQYFAQQPQFKNLSMGMSDDYRLAIEEGSTMVRVGSSIFGNRIYPSK
jgi:pyridoxal phosphate enzyme (YggS family)